MISEEADKAFRRAWVASSDGSNASLATRKALKALAFEVPELWEFVQKQEALDGEQ